MKVRIILFTFALVVWATIHLAEAQQSGKVHRIGLLISASNVIEPFTDAFRQGMRDLGYIEGKNIVLEIRGGEAEPARIADLAAELVGLKVDIIVAVGGQALHAAAKATSTIPIVMRTEGDPVKSGLVASLARPGGNITGVYAMSVELSGKRLELLAEVVPGLKRIAVLTTASKFAATDEYKDMEAAARVLGAKLQILTPLDPDTIDRAFLAIGKEGAQALIVIPSPRYAIERGAWADAAALEPRPSTPAADAITYFTRAMGAVRKGDTASAQRDVEQLESLKNTLTKSKQKYWADQVEIQRRAAAAWVAQAEGKKNEALKLMRSAAALEDASEKHVAMENRLWPMRELLGEMLLQLNEPAQALKEFEASFKAAPNRFRGYYGAAKAAERLGDEKKTKIYYEKLVELCRQADTERPEMVEAKAFLAKK